MEIDYTSRQQRLAMAQAHAQSFQFNAPVTVDGNSDILYQGPVGEELRDLKSWVKAYNKANRHNPQETQTYRVGLQGRLGPKSEFAHLYKGMQNRRIKLKHSSYVGVYIWGTTKTEHLTANYYGRS